MARLCVYFHKSLYGSTRTQHNDARLPCSAPADCGTAQSTDSLEGEWLLPMPLPPRPAGFSRLARDRITSPRRQARWSLWHSSWLMAETLVGTFNKWECADSRLSSRRFAAIDRPSALQATSFCRLVDSICRFLRLAAGTSLGSGRGTKTMHQLLDLYESKWGLNSEDVANSKILVTAQRVDAQQLRLPEAAGQLCTESLLPVDLAAQFRDGAARTLATADIPEPLPRPCFMVDKTEEKLLRRRLVEAGMVTLLPESQIARRQNDRLLLNGCFGVPHPKGMRAIFDCRPANEGEARLRWSCLPNGAQITWLRLLRSEGLRGSGDDLSNWFYQLRESEALVPRRAFGRPIDPREARELGFPAAEPHRMALQVLGMGSRNAPDVAQRAHEFVLESAGLLLPENTLKYDRPIPCRAKLLEGVYIDDHAVMAVVPLPELGSDNGPDRVMIQKSHRAYEEHHVQRAEDKAFGFARTGSQKADERFTIWGTAVDGRRGVARVPHKKTAEIMGLVLAALSLPTVCKLISVRILGLLVHPFMHRRSCCAVLQQSYTWLAGLAPGTEYPWSRAVKAELLAAALLLPVAEADLRSPVSAMISCTDATPLRGGAVRALFTRTSATSCMTTGKRGESGLVWTGAPTTASGFPAP
jgi:hypothetical protein